MQIAALWDDLYYDEVVTEPITQAARILDALDVARDVDIEPSVARLSDHVSDEWVDRFKREAR